MTKNPNNSRMQALNQAFQGILAEIKRVNWPTLTKTQQTVTSVFLVLIMFSLVIWLIDSSVFGLLNFLGFFGN